MATASKPARKTTPTAAAAKKIAGVPLPATKPLAGSFAAPKGKAVKPAAPKVTKPATPAKPAAPAAAPTAAAAKPAKAPKPAKEDKPAKPPKAKLVRDSFTIPKAEYAAIEELKTRAAKLGRPAKKSEVLRAGIKLLAALKDESLLAALGAVPAIKTGRPGKD